MRKPIFEILLLISIPLTLLTLYIGNDPVWANKNNLLASSMGATPGIAPVSQPKFSTTMLEMAEMIGVWPLYQQLKNEQERTKTLPAQGNAMEKMASQQKIIYLRVQIAQYIQNANLELNSLIGKLNSGVSDLADRKAIISDDRARMLRRNTFINLISGGLTKIGGYSSALTPAPAIPTNVLEVFDGGIQVLLSISTIKQQRSESKLFKSKPEILTAFITGHNVTDEQFPESVWTYLNKHDGLLKSRRQLLIEHWIRTGRLVDSNGNKHKQKSTSSGVTYPKEKIVMDDIDDAMAMMADIQSSVYGMESALMELSRLIKASYKDDPPF